MSSERLITIVLLLYLEGHPFRLHVRTESRKCVTENSRSHYLNFTPGHMQAPYVATKRSSLSSVIRTTAFSIYETDIGNLQVKCISYRTNLQVKCTSYAILLTIRQFTRAMHMWRQSKQINYAIGSVYMRWASPPKWASSLREMVFTGVYMRSVLSQSSELAGSWPLFRVLKRNILMF